MSASSPQDTSPRGAGSPGDSGPELNEAAADSGAWPAAEHMLDIAESVISELALGPRGSALLDIAEPLLSEHGKPPAPSPLLPHVQPDGGDQGRPDSVLHPLVDSVQVVPAPAGDARLRFRVPLAPVPEERSRNGRAAVRRRVLLG